jgi:hypothetical protein
MGYGPLKISEFRYTARFPACHCIESLNIGNKCKCLAYWFFKSVTIKVSLLGNTVEDIVMQETVEFICYGVVLFEIR